MASERDARRRACVDKATAELEALAARGVRMGGNAFSSVLLAKGELSDAEKNDGAGFDGEDGGALRASLSRLGYAPEDWAALLTVDDAGAALDAQTMREAVTALDPATLVCCDEPSANAVREAYADDLAVVERLEEALLTPGVVAHVCGMRVLNLGGFAAALATGDAHAKQVMWARLKLIPPLGEPF